MARSNIEVGRSSCLYSCGMRVAICTIHSGVDTCMQGQRAGPPKEPATATGVPWGHSCQLIYHSLNFASTATSELSLSNWMHAHVCAPHEYCMPDPPRPHHSTLSPGLCACTRSAEKRVYMPTHKIPQVMPLTAVLSEIRSWPSVDDMIQCQLG